MDFQQYYNLESYLLNTVRPRFRKRGYLSAFDFFCIVIWKANRAKSKVAKKLLDKGYKNLNTATKALTAGLGKTTNPKDRLRYLVKDWGFGLPMASAILAVLYPKKFTVYDVRVCDVLRSFHGLKSRTNFDNLWRGYEEFKNAVEKSAPGGTTCTCQAEIGPVCKGKIHRGCSANAIARGTRVAACQRLDRVHPPGGNLLAVCR